MVKAKASRWYEIRCNSASLHSPLCSLRQHSAPEKCAGCLESHQLLKSKRDRYTWWPYHAETALPTEDRLMVQDLSSSCLEKGPSEGGHARHVQQLARVFFPEGLGSSLQGSPCPHKKRE